MENNQELKAVHDPLFCEEGDVPYNLNIEKGTGYESIENKFYNPGNIPACNPENDCSIIQNFLGEEVDEWEIIKNQYDLAFKDKKRLLIIREFAEQQLKDVDSDLTAVNINISILDDRYRKYKDNALTNKDFK